mmetsp:Transcript_46018/g.90678  ORF Transcript_46018/g.90678 Transcript_46018/m.90678 type:complete len:97 (-) Transcript_46018:1432-1722(-)
MLLEGSNFAAMLSTACMMAACMKGKRKKSLRRLTWSSFSCERVREASWCQSVKRKEKRREERREDVSQEQQGQSGVGGVAAVFLKQGRKEKENQAE